MAINLSEIETRVVGSLVEKALTTPEYYPLTLNALISACNQKSNRDPVMSVGETNLLAAIDSLRDKNLVYLYYGSTSRTVKYKHMLQGVLGIGDREVAVLAVLFLRGPQTVGELRERTGRLYEFSGIGEVQEVLDEMSRGDEPLVVKLERLPGQKESRYAHTLSGEIDVAALAAAHADTGSRAGSSDRITQLEETVKRLTEEFDQLKATFEEFKKQFE